MLQVKRAGHSTLTTPDIGRAVDYFTRIVGLNLVGRDKDRAVLATKSGLEAIVLERGNGGEASRLSFQIAPGSELDAIAARLTQAGIKSERRHDITPGIRDALAFKDPKGTTLEIFADCAFAPDDDTFTGVMPLKLGHIAYTCPDVAGMVKFYCDLLGFRVSDWRSDFFAFLQEDKIYSLRLRDRFPISGNAGSTRCAEVRNTRTCATFLPKSGCPGPTWCASRRM